MKIFINTIAGIAFIGQLIAFIFNGLTLQKLESIVDELFNYALFAGYLCSLLSVAIFVIIYNFNILFLHHVCCYYLIYILLEKFFISYALRQQNPEKPDVLSYTRLFFFSNNLITQWISMYSMIGYPFY